MRFIYTDRFASVRIQFRCLISSWPIEIFNSQRIQLDPLPFVKKMYPFEIGLQIHALAALNLRSRGEASDEPQFSA